MVMRVVLILLFFFAGNVLAALPARYMQTTKDAAIWSQIGDKMVTVGTIR
ncbi:polysaccharide deacetylase family protein, partial [Salmonella enterica subsp. enterica serovar Meleagridis]|nr:polysaccharide deacetylase family protein [Salmonella enterica subsp. enterica serovar Meleagridis]